MKRLLIYMALLLACMGAWAHKASDSYLNIAVTDAGISARWDIALRDLEYAVGVDADGDGNITWAETRAKHAEIASYALARLALQVDGMACALKAAPHQQVDRHTDGAYTVLQIAVSCAATTGAPAASGASAPAASNAPEQLKITYGLFADIDPQHRGLLNLNFNGESRAAVFSPEKPQQTFVLKERPAKDQLLDYGREGVWHIWIGFDHILFLLSLLLPAVLVWRKPFGWEPAESFYASFVDVAKIVTAFTLAHSITLSLAALGFISLPSRVVESAIAASVVLAALNNVWPVFLGRRWLVAFCFGLIHGFGFASVLADLGLPQEALALALLGFNLGVECGQLAIVAVFLPIAYLLRRTWLYRKLVLVGGSLAIAALAGVWLAERAANFKVLPF